MWASVDARFAWRYCWFGFGGARANQRMVWGHGAIYALRIATAIKDGKISVESK